MNLGLKGIKEYIAGPYYNEVSFIVYKDIFTRTYLKVHDCLVVDPDGRVIACSSDGRNYIIDDNHIIEKVNETDDIFNVYNQSDKENPVLTLFFYYK